MTKKEIVYNNGEESCNNKKRVFVIARKKKWFA
jgi:hypothetical protein